MSFKKRFDLRVVSQLFYPELVSSGQALTELVEELSSKGIKIKVIASQPTILENSGKVSKIVDYHNIHIVRTWSTRLPKLSFFGKLTNLLTFFFTASIEVLFKDRKVPLLLVTNPPFLALLGWFSNLINKARFGVLLFDIMPEQAELLGLIKTNGIIAKIWRRFNYLWYLRSSYVVVLSSDMLNGAIDNANLKGSKHEAKCRAKTHSIHVWSDDRLIKPIEKSDSKLAKELNVYNKFVIQYSGNHGRFHDIESVLKIADAMSKDQHVIFQFIGEGHKKKLVEEFITNRKPGNIYSSSYVPKEYLSDSLSMADLGIIAQMPKQERVCYPSKLLGIMSSGRAILAICSSESEMAKMIMENDLGFVVENGDVDSAVKIIKMCVSDPNLNKVKGMNAFNFLKRSLTLQHAAEKYYSLIRNA
jgi:glycosyltransferase involved in cell wall biosynthesis